MSNHNGQIMEENTAHFYISPTEINSEHTNFLYKEILAAGKKQRTVLGQLAKTDE